MKVVEINHPLVKHKLGVMRRVDIRTKEFRELTFEISSLLTYAATSDLVTRPLVVEGWQGPVPITQLTGEKITVVPIMRAGLGMATGVLQQLPTAPISMVGLYRDEVTLKPVVYFQKLAANLPECTALVVDMMLATGGSIACTIQLLKNSGCRQIKLLVLIAAPEGIAHLKTVYPESEIVLYTAAIDKGLDSQGRIIPGLGDAGDRLFASH